MKKFLMGSMYLGWYFVLNAEVGCMERSMHAYACDMGPEVCCLRKYDNKSYFKVKDCSCPCWRYTHSWRRYRCLQCMHYHDPKEFEIIAVPESEETFRHCRKK